MTPRNDPVKEKLSINVSLMVFLHMCHNKENILILDIYCPGCVCRKTAK